jgi:glycosyltransferase involved in cell wall biosynthesis
MMRNESDNLCLWLFLYGAFLFVFHVLPPFLTRFFLWPLSLGDTIDLFTPFAVIPFAYVLYSRLNRFSQPSLSAESSVRSQKIMAKVILGVGFLSYVEGHGLHLSANSIARLLQGREGTNVFRATYFFDEIISHYIWISGLYLISIGLILFAFKLIFPPFVRKRMIFLSSGAFFYGFTFTVEAIEGQTVIFSFPAAILGFIFTFFLFLKGKRGQRKNPILLFFMSAYFLCILLFLFWGIFQSGFPQFSELGWI